MIEFRTPLTWRLLYWFGLLLQTVVLSFALSSGQTIWVFSAGGFLVFFFINALQSRSPIRISEDGVADDRLLARKGWHWEDVDSVDIRAGSWMHPDIIVRHKAGKPLALNLTALRATTEGRTVDRGAAVVALITLARGGGASVNDTR